MAAAVEIGEIEAPADEHGALGVLGTRRDRKRERLLCHGLNQAKSFLARSLEGDHSAIGRVQIGLKIVEAPGAADIAIASCVIAAERDRRADGGALRIERYRAQATHIHHQPDERDKEVAAVLAHCRNRGMRLRPIHRMDQDVAIDRRAKRVPIDPVRSRGAIGCRDEGALALIVEEAAAARMPAHARKNIPERLEHLRRACLHVGQVQEVGWAFGALERINHMAARMTCCDRFLIEDRG